MQTAPIPINDTDRLEALRKLNILDTPPEERFDRITKLAAKIFNVPISTISLVDANREWFKSVCGLNHTEGDRAVSFCGHALLEKEMLIIPDAKNDPRFSDNPMVVGEPLSTNRPMFEALIHILKKNGITVDLVVPEIAFELQSGKKIPADTFFSLLTEQKKLALSVNFLT